MKINKILNKKIFDELNFFSSKAFFFDNGVEKGLVLNGEKTIAF
jgi:hypothetical protein